MEAVADVWKDEGESGLREPWAGRIEFCARSRGDGRERPACDHPPSSASAKGNAGNPGGDEGRRRLR
eukprot:3653989-Pyramimonas_sp.AAC.1